MATSSDVIKSFTIKVNTDNGKVKVEGLTKSFIRADKALDQMTNGLKQNTAAATTNAKAHKQVDAAVGGASAVSLEFGRVISDAPYGIRGVANNITQMASQFTQLTTKIDATTGKAVGWRRAMKTIGGTLMGPTGILIAITAVVAALDYFAGGMSSAKESVEDMNEGLKEQIQIVSLLETEFLDSNATLEDRMGIMKGLSRVESKIAKQLAAANGDKVKEAAIIKKFREQKILELKLREKEFEIKKQASIFDENSERARQFRDGELGVLQFGANFGKTNKLINESLIARDKAMDEYVELLKGLEKDESKSNKIRLRQSRSFKQKMFDLSKLLLSNEEEEAKMKENNIVAQMELEKVYADRDIELQTQLFKDKEKLRFENYLKTIKGTTNEKAMRLQAEKDYSESILMADTEKWEALISNASLYSAKLAEVELEEKIKKDKLVADGFAKQVEGLSSGNAVTDAANDPLRDIARQAQQDEINFRLSQESEGSFAYMQIKQEESDFLAKLAMEDIKTEQDKKNEMTRIQMEYVGFVAQTGQLLRSISGESKAMAILALAVEKGAAVAKVVVEANASVASRTAAHNAMPSYINIPTPVGIASIPNLAKGLDKVSMAKDITKTKVGAGLAIANILASTLTSKGGVGGGGSGGGESAGRTFDFNLVGSTGENQAAQATAGALGQPVQAYVVSSAISSQQELDNSILGQASFGDD